MTAKVKVYAQCCIDPRFRHAFQKFIRKKYGVREDQYDLKTDAGAIGEIAKGSGHNGGHVYEWLMFNLEVGIDRHGAEIVVLCQHLDCAYYGGSKKFASRAAEVEKQRQELRSAAKKIQARFPQVKIDAYVITKQRNEYVLEPVDLAPAT